MASTIFLGYRFGEQRQMKEPLLSMFMRTDVEWSCNSGISPIIAKGNIIEGIVAKE